MVFFGADGATEGNANMINIENRIGAVGFGAVLFPDWIVDRLLPLKLIKVDKQTGQPLRDPGTGYCIPCQPNEPGEFIGKIVRGDPVKDFQGYRDPQATKKKVLSDVFQKGDLYFRSGDILTSDEFGWLYFKDRAGDTFRYACLIHSRTPLKIGLSIWLPCYVRLLVNWVLLQACQTTFNCFNPSPKKGECTFHASETEINKIFFLEKSFSDGSLFIRDGGRP